MHREKFTLDVLETTVRFGLRPNRPDLIIEYLAIIKQIINNTSSQPEKFRFAARATRIIYDTIADQKLDCTWRDVCSDYIYLCFRLLHANTLFEHQFFQIRQFRYQFAALQTQI